MINRAIEVFDRVVVGVVHNPSKTPFFAAEERVALLDEMVGGRAEVQAFEGLLVDFARLKNVDVVVKGLRAISDFDYELQMAQMNYTLAGMETLFLPTNPQWEDTFASDHGETLVAVHSEDAEDIEVALDALRGTDPMRLARCGRDGHLRDL